MVVVGLWLFLMVPCDGMQCVIVVLPDHSHVLFCSLCPFSAVPNGRERYYFTLCNFP